MRVGYKSQHNKRNVEYMQDKTPGLIEDNILNVNDQGLWPNKNSTDEIILLTYLQFSVIKIQENLPCM